MLLRAIALGMARDGSGWLGMVGMARDRPGPPGPAGPTGGGRARGVGPGLWPWVGLRLAACDDQLPFRTRRLLRHGRIRRPKGQRHAGRVRCAGACCAARTPPWEVPDEAPPRATAGAGEPPRAPCPAFCSSNSLIVKLPTWVRTACVHTRTSRAVTHTTHRPRPGPLTAHRTAYLCGSYSPTPR